jgi:hypothetical protein
MSSVVYSCDGVGGPALDAGLSALAALRKQLQTKEAKIGNKKKRKVADTAGMGTGYGGNGGTSTAAAQKKMDSAHQSEVETDLKLTRAFNDIRCAIASDQGTSNDTQSIKNKLSSHSALKYFLKLLLHNDSMTDIDTRKQLYLAVMNLLCVLAREPLTALFLIEPLSEEDIGAEKGAGTGADKGAGADAGTGEGEESDVEGGCVLELVKELDDVASTFIALQSNADGGEEMHMHLDQMEIPFKIR